MKPCYCGGHEEVVSLQGHLILSICFPQKPSYSTHLHRNMAPPPNTQEIGFYNRPPARHVHVQCLLLQLLTAYPDIPSGPAGPEYHD